MLKRILLKNKFNTTQKIAMKTLLINKENLIVLLFQIKESLLNRDRDNLHHILQGKHLKV